MKIIIIMPRQKSTPFACPRCGYEVQIYHAMKKHLHERKRPCQATKSSIILTDEIKEIILRDSVYREKQEPVVAQTNTVQTTYNNNNIHIHINNNFNNFISKVPLNTMLSAVTDCTGTCQEYVDDMLERTMGWLGDIDTDRLNHNPTPALKITDYPKWFDHITKYSEGTLPCIFTDQQATCVIESNDEEKKEKKHAFVTEYEFIVLVLKKAQEMYFNAYELHLKERATFDHPDNVIVARAYNLLVAYYKVLQTFGLYTTLAPAHQQAWREAENASAESKEELRNKFISIVKENSDRNREYIMSLIKNIVMTVKLPLTHTSVPGM